ncbi:unnamed protein product, partial [Rotaria sp. Silwood2]
MKIDFSSSEALNVHEFNTNNYESPFLYQLQLNVLLKSSEEIFIRDSKAHRKIASYQLRIPDPRITWTSHYKEEYLRHLKAGPSMSHQFLFNTYFKDGTISYAP